MEKVYTSGCVDGDAMKNSCSLVLYHTAGVFDLGKIKFSVFSNSEAYSLIEALL